MPVAEKSCLELCLKTEHSLQSMYLEETEEYKYDKHIGKLIRKNPNMKCVYYLLRKEPVIMGVLITSKNGDRKNHATYSQSGEV